MADTAVLPIKASQAMEGRKIDKRTLVGHIHPRAHRFNNDAVALLRQVLAARRWHTSTHRCIWMPSPEEDSHQFVGTVSMAAHPAVNAGGTGPLRAMRAFGIAPTEKGQMCPRSRSFF